MGNEKKKENDIHSFPLSTFYISACRQGLKQVMSSGPVSATCVGRAESCVCHPGGTVSNRRAVSHLHGAFFLYQCEEACYHTQRVQLGEL